MVDVPLSSGFAKTDTTISAIAQRDIAARMERIPLTRTQIKARIVVGTATFFDGYDLLMLGLVMPVLAGAWHLSNAEIGYLLSGTFFGQLLGAILFPWIAERYGRLRAASYSIWVVGLMSLVCAASWNFGTLISSRVIQGIGIGGEIPVASTYINELACAKVRGRFFLMYEAAFAAGYLIATLLAVLLVVRFGWQLMFIIGALPAFVAALMRRMLPESPRWLASKGRTGEADKIVSQMESEAEAKLGGKLPAPDYSVAPPPVGTRTDLRELFTPFLSSAHAGCVVGLGLELLRHAGDEFMAADDLSSGTASLGAAIARIHLGDALHLDPQCDRGRLGDRSHRPACLDRFLAVDWQSVAAGARLRGRYQSDRAVGLRHRRQLLPGLGLGVDLRLHRRALSDTDARARLRHGLDHTQRLHDDEPDGGRVHAHRLWPAGRIHDAGSRAADPVPHGAGMGHRDQRARLEEVSP